MAKKNGFGMKTSTTNNVYSLLKDSQTNVQDLKRQGGHYSNHWKDAKKK